MSDETREKIHERQIAEILENHRTDPGHWYSYGIGKYETIAKEILEMPQLKEALKNAEWNETRKKVHDLEKELAEKTLHDIYEIFKIPIYDGLVEYLKSLPDISNIEIYRRCPECHTRIECPNCADVGYIVSSRSGHGCNGTDEDCARVCPVEIPEQEQCEFCHVEEGSRFNCKCKGKGEQTRPLQHGDYELKIASMDVASNGSAALYNTWGLNKGLRDNGWKERGESG